MCEMVIKSREKNDMCWVTVKLFQAALIWDCSKIKNKPTANYNRDISLRYLEDESPLCSEAVLQEEGALVACHAVEQHPQHSTQNTFL